VLLLLPTIDVYLPLSTCLQVLGQVPSDSGSEESGDGEEEGAGHVLWDLWFAQHAATSVERHVTVPVGARDLAELKSCAPLVALVF
jgi:hypothetical protein